MPGCAAVGCNNRSEKGYIMKCFPRNPKLRKIWQERVARADWEPSNNSFLCHVHFEPQEWSITQTGRIRLRKNAVPSIFTVTSTRKSPKKKTKIINGKEENLFQSECSVEYMEVDTEHSSTGHLEEKDSDSQGACDSSVQSSESKLKYISKPVGDREEKKKNINTESNKKSTIMITEDNYTDIINAVKEDNIKMKVNDKQLLSISPSTIVKKEVKLEVMDHNTFGDSYDEIEEKLKQICDGGGSTEDENYKNMQKNKSQKEDEDAEIIHLCCDLNNDEHKADASVNKSPSFPPKGKAEHTLTEKEENVEIIFGIESEDEKISQTIPKASKLNENAAVSNKEATVKDEKKVFNEDIEENFTKDEVHVIPNIRAAMKRKRRTREEIMKSIKKSIRSTSDADINSSSNSDLSDTDTDTRNDSSVFSRNIKGLSKTNDMDIETARFVIKVTGDPDDVSEIIEELSSNTLETQNCPVYKNEENDAFVTSVITVISQKNLTDVVYSDLSSPIRKEDYIPISKNESIAEHSPCKVIEPSERAFDFAQSPKKSQPSSFRHTCSEEENKTQTKFPSQNSSPTAVVPREKNDKCVVSDCEELLERIQIQENVIGKLIDQLIIYKEIENDRRNKNLGQDVQNKEADQSPKLNMRSANTQSPTLTKKVLESKQRLIEDLSNRVNYFEEMNKKLMKTVTLESQQKRKLEGQIRQKDNRIKELNWKLEKASKYLERAEKNTNTYRRKMLNMQTIMRRRKLLDEKMTKFNEMLIDSSRQEFTEKALVMAADIRKNCGRSGYDKLLSYGFPLPPLPALRKGVLNEDTMDHNKSDGEKTKSSAPKLNIKAEDAPNDESEAEGKDAQVPDSTAKTSELDGAETVTGTVQDIFEENNDGDDFSTNELREHFILQLNAVM
ncbi:uncharacterized protein LOC143215689 [Lasioglossum baleicum]|uniref:uncharacterized protein LOC143215689 n=1 Tax=Lasioglossum baleicum TaxID=434251 RepID=UPI003FCD3E48